ncbi:MAG: cysteine--tRNA ligase [Sulfuricurvum sp.]
MLLYDSVTRSKREFIPQNPPSVTMYVCGPTVYDDAHLGHAKSALTFDLLQRTLEANGYNVTYARNITDIDDKIIQKSIDELRSVDEITSYYIEAYHNDMSAIGVKKPTIEPRATKSLDAMFEMIQKLLEGGFAYQISNGDIYFDTAKDSAYLSLSKRVQDDADRQNRVASSDEKKNPADFALWKAVGEGVKFSSPFGDGRPGWHIECSAMIEKHLASKDTPFAIDIHGGGADLLFPHHENEAAQTRCSSKHALSAYWVHNGFITINNEKMSKSLGNSFFLRDALKIYDGEVLRFYLLSVHYRSNFNFSELDLEVSKKRLDRLYRLKKRLFGMGHKEVESSFKVRILDALSDDLNISQALSVLDEFISYANEILDQNPKDKLARDEILSTLAYIEDLLGFGLQNPFEYFQHGLSKDLKKEIEDLIIKRNEAKKAKDYATADEMRSALEGLGVSVMDTQEGTFWEKV